MKLRMMWAVALAIGLAGTVTYAQGNGRVTRDTYSAEWEGLVVAGCDDGLGGTFDVWERWEATYRGITIYNKSGQIQQQVGQVSYTTDYYYNSTTLKRVNALPAEKEEVRYLYEDGVMVGATDAGLMIGVNIPGYGRLFTETGVAKFEFPWSIIFNSGHNDFWTGDPAAAAALSAALCDTLK